MRNRTATHCLIGVVHVVLILVVSLSANVPNSAEKGSENIQGSWLPASAELGGQMFPDEVRKSIKLVVKDDHYTVTVGPAVDQGNLKLNPTTKPKQLDIIGTDGPNKGKTYLAIYDRDGDTLRICYDLSGKNRPTEFKSKPGSQEFFVTYKLEKQARDFGPSAYTQQRQSNTSQRSKIMELGNFSVSLAVKDIEASKQFYEKLGFTVFMGNQSQNWLIMKNGTCIIGLFHGMFDKNIMTFNPGWNSDAQKLDKFTDVRELQRKLKTSGITITPEADETTTGPASFMITDPDGNTILIDQHV